MGKREYAFSYLDIIFIWTNMRKEYQKKGKRLIYFNISVVEGWNALYSLKHSSMLSWKSDLEKNFRVSAAHRAEASDKGAHNWQACVQDEEGKKPPL